MMTFFGNGKQAGSHESRKTIGAQFNLCLDREWKAVSRKPVYSCEKNSTRFGWVVGVSEHVSE